MLLILVEVFMKVARWSTTATDCSHRATYLHATYSSGSICESGYLHATYPVGSICESGLSVHNSHRLQAQSYHHATYSGGSICESGLSVHKTSCLCNINKTSTTRDVQGQLLAMLRTLQLVHHNCMLGGSEVHLPSCQLKDLLQ